MRSLRPKRKEDGPRLIVPAGIPPTDLVVRHVKGGKDAVLPEQLRQQSRTWAESETNVPYRANSIGSKNVIPGHVFIRVSDFFFLVFLFQVFSRVESGRVSRCFRRLAGRVGSGRLGSSRVG